MSKVKAWHFLPDDGKLRYGDSRTPEVGEWLTCSPGELELCYNGMHASKDILDALSYAPGSTICRVELRGEVIQGDNKLVARERKILWKLDATETLRKFARMCALDVVHLWDAPEVVIRYLKTGEESIREAAADAARAAARAAYAADARAYAADAAAWATALDAAPDAVWAAVYAAYAARAAARADDAAAWAPAREKQSRRLTRMFREQHRREVADANAER
jgi:hypothetical protein